MANQRMYLYHPPSNSAIFLGKRNSEGYWNECIDYAERLEKFYENAYAETDWSARNPDDVFKIAYEVAGIGDGRFLLPIDARLF